MRTLEELCQRYHAVALEVNAHRLVYETASERTEGRVDVEPVYELQIYPVTSVGFYLFYGNSLADVLAQAAAADL